MSQGFAAEKPSVDETFRVVLSHPLLIEAVKAHNKKCPGGPECAWNEIEKRIHDMTRVHVFGFDLASGPDYTKTAGEEQTDAPKSSVVVYFKNGDRLDIDNVSSAELKEYEDVLEVETRDGEVHYITVRNMNHAVWKGGA